MAKQQTEVDHDFDDCIANCTECHRVCLETMEYCLRMGRRGHAAPAHIRLLADCAQICQTNADFMMRGSVFTEVCAACAEVCSRCGNDCALIDPDDAQMQECAEICLRCAAICGEIAGE